MSTQMQREREYASVVTSYRERWIPSLEQLTIRAVVEIPFSLIDPQISKIQQMKEMAKNAFEENSEIYRKYFCDWRTLAVASYSNRHGEHYLLEVTCNVRER